MSGLSVNCDICRTLVQDITNGYYTCDQQCDWDKCKGCYNTFNEQRARLQAQAGIQVIQGKTCDKGQVLQFSNMPRSRAPYNG